MNKDFSDGPKTPNVGMLPMRRPAQCHPTLRPNDPAMRVMTDFTRRLAVTVDPDCQIDAALADMRRASVRAMLVAQVDWVLGLVTSYDIEGTRSVRFATRPHVRRREDIRVRDIMTPWKDLPTLDVSTVQGSRISDLLEIFEGVGVRHLLVVENDEYGAEIVRGLISRSRIERQLQAAPIRSAAGREFRIQGHSAVDENTRPGDVIG